ncbi:hypothetical protein [Escherichia coli]|uniref:hypothetical protein n=1 Tax=Escherichia coli TaxID=562 RepID=UPI0008FBFD4E|nr:hypothetical protein [Salmonella enterica subsp. enterica]EDI2356371.1 hypothetical protein [Salmonella enterica subsp. enterica serovar Heidelberg]MDJ1194480.1 hypothetical protein [Escherichia coli]
MPQLARAPASLRRPGASQQDGALYCACERQRATGATPGTNIKPSQVILFYLPFAEHVFRMFSCK